MVLQKYVECRGVIAVLVREEDGKEVVRINALCLQGLAKCACAAACVDQYGMLAHGKESRVTLRARVK